MKYLLHIDTSTDTAVIALAGDGNILALRSSSEARSHAATINSMIQDVLTASGCLLQNIDAVAVCGGPGSYTGLRIGMATAKGICYALDKPLIMADRLTLLAYKVWLDNKSRYSQFITLITAREKEYFIAGYDADFINIIAPQHIFELQLPDLIKKKNAFVVSDERSEFFNSLIISDLKINNNIFIDHDAWATYAFDQYNCNSNVNLAMAEPFYLKQVYTHK